MAAVGQGRRLWRRCPRSGGRTGADGIDPDAGKLLLSEAHEAARGSSGIRSTQHDRDLEGDDPVEQGPFSSPNWPRRRWTPRPVSRSPSSPRRTSPTRSLSYAVAVNETLTHATGASPLFTCAVSCQALG